MHHENLVFVAGLPRAGSTLLVNLLGQNPTHHVTPTSGLIEMLVSIQSNWPNYIEFKAEGLDKVKPRILTAMKGLLTGFFEQELAAGKTVFDKSRGWLQYVEPLEECLGRPVKVIVPVRDVRAIVASFEKLYRRRSIDYRVPQGDAYFAAQTVEGRAQVLLSPGGVVGIAINRLRDALQRGVGDRLVIVPYPALTTRPRETMDLLQQALGLPPFDYDPDNVQQVTEENDSYHGMKLHKIRPRIEPPNEVPWEGVLPPALCESLSAAYADIAALSPIPPPPATARPVNGKQSHSGPRQRLHEMIPVAP